MKKKSNKQRLELLKIEIEQMKFQLRIKECTFEIWQLQEALSQKQSPKAALELRKQFYFKVEELIDISTPLK